MNIAYDRYRVCNHLNCIFEPECKGKMNGKRPIPITAFNFINRKSIEIHITNVDVQVNAYYSNQLYACHVR